MRWHLALVLVLFGCGSDSESEMAADASVAQADAGAVTDAAVSTEAVIYLNFSGQVLQPGADDDSANNVSRLIVEETTIAPFDASAFTNTQPQDIFTAAVTAQIRAYYDPFAVEIVTERPPSGDYVMAVIGGNPEDVGLFACTDDDLSCSLGTAWLDCSPFPSTEVGDVVYNVDGNRGVVYVFANVFTRFPERTYQESVLRMAATIAHEVGHSFGLAHVDDPECVMNRDSTGVTAKFCVAPYQEADGHCGRGATQDAPSILDEVFASQ